MKERQLLREMFDAYPDATLVWLHRDPVQVAASRTMMMADIAEGDRKSVV